MTPFSIERGRFLNSIRLHPMRFLVAVAMASVACSSAAAGPRGVSPYLPLNLSPEIEAQIEQVMILAGKPVMRRPFAAAAVHSALPKACEHDPVLCASVKRYLARYKEAWGITDLGLQAGSGAESKQPVPNERGKRADDEWAAVGRAYWQPSDFVILTAATSAFQGDAEPAGSLLSAGIEYAQLDIGWRDRWLSPMSDSSMVISTAAPTMPSVTLSNYAPMTRFGLQYEFFMAEMSQTANILSADRLVKGKPALAGIHVAAEPVSGWSFGINRLMQYGGGGRSKSFKDLLKAFFDPTNYDNTGTEERREFGNQVASLTSSLVVPGRIPFVAYAEYAGEDTVRNRPHLLGNVALSVGLRWPSLPGSFDLTVEASEWQNAWYVHHVYGDGLTHDGLAIGHWFGNQREFGDDVVGHSGMVRLGWRPRFGGQLAVRYRMLVNEDYSPAAYEDGYELSLGYSRAWGTFVVGAEVQAGRDVFGEDLSAVRASIRYSELPDRIAAAMAATESSFASRRAHLFVDAGVSASKVMVDEDTNAPRELLPVRTAGHFGFGVRRIGEGRHDVGARIELDDIEGRLLASVRMIDYRYRFDAPISLGLFLGAARYDLATPAYGLYYGAGLQWRDFLKGWDLNLDARYAEKTSRDYVLPQDPDFDRRNAYYDIYGASLYVSRRF
jgi:hypothetical protein